jgi:hypothetical protein
LAFAGTRKLDEVVEIKMKPGMEVLDPGRRDATSLMSERSALWGNDLTPLSQLS